MSAQNREKLTSSLPPPLSAMAHIPFSVWTHRENFEKLEVFCTKKCGRPHLKNFPPPLSEKCPQWANPLPPEWRRLLWTAPYKY